MLTYAADKLLCLSPDLNPRRRSHSWQCVPRLVV